MKKKENGKWKWIFYLYLLLIVRLIVFKYPYENLWNIALAWHPAVVKEGLQSANLELFKTIKMYIRYYERLNSFENLFGNILIFIPYGMLYPLAFEERKKRMLFLPRTLLFIFGIEVFQMISAFGKFDVDDILLNCMGTVIGMIFMIAILKVKCYSINSISR